MAKKGYLIWFFNNKGIANFIGAAVMAGDGRRIRRLRDDAEIRRPRFTPEGFRRFAFKWAACLIL